MKIKSLLDIPIKLENKRLSQESSLFQECDYILRKLDKLGGVFRFIEEDLPEIGNEKILSEINNIKQLIIGKFQVNNEDCNEKFILEFIHNLVVKIMKATNIFMINNVLQENAR